MAKKYLDQNGLLYFWQKIKTKFALATHNHTKSEITDFPTSMTPSSHTHGNITNAGALQSTDVTIANGDKLVVTDSSNSNKIARTGTSFDGSTTTKALTQKGTFETFLQEHQDISGKVDKVSGKGLSTNDYTTAEKNKLAGIASGATVDDHKWNDVELAHADFATDIGTDSDYRGYIPVIGGVSAGITPSIDSTSSKMLKLSTFTTDVNSVVGRDKDGYIWTQTPTSGDSSNRAATTAFVSSAVSGAVSGKVNGNARVFMGRCNDYSDTAAKTVQCEAYDQFVSGDILVVNFVSSNTAANPTLNVNSKGSKPVVQVKNGNLQVLDTPSSLRKTCVFVYENGWILQGANDDTTYSNATTSAAGLMSTTDKGKIDKLVFDSNNLIDSSILPSYVDDVIEAYPLSGATELSSSWLSTSSGGSALTPETGKIYVLMAASTSYAANTQFRWSGTTYVKLSDGGVSEITNSEIDTIVAS